MKKSILLIFLTITFSCASIYAVQNISKGVQQVKLDNGLTVLIKENHSQPLVSVQVWVKVGSVNEKDSQKGLTHFLEHLLFKGTKNYPGDEISRRVEAQGGIINAGTSKEYTHYHIDIPELAKIHYTTNRRYSSGRNFHEIHVGIAGNLQSLTYRHNTDIAAIWTNQANFRDADTLIYSKFVGADMLLLIINETNPAFLRLVF
jgi:hypothetical protein